MFNKLFKKKEETSPEKLSIEIEKSVNIPTQITPKISLEEQKQRHKQRKRLIIDEFGRSVLNLVKKDDRLFDGIWTPLHAIDLLIVDFPEGSDIKKVIEDSIQSSIETHKENLKEKIYRQSFNLQPGNLLMVVKNQYGEPIAIFKNRRRDVERLVECLNPKIHKLVLIRHFIPPVPEDLYKYDDIDLPPKFEEAIKDIVNYCDLNYSLDNLTFDKWVKLISGLDDSGTVLHLPNSEEEVDLSEILDADYSNIGYDKITLKQILKDTVEKHTVVIPIFILFLGFFCSESSEKNVFAYHYLFTATGSSKELSTTRGAFSFPKLFNELLDESLLPRQFNKCLAIIYNEAFRMRQPEIDDLLIHFRERYNPTVEK